MSFSRGFFTRFLIVVAAVFASVNSARADLLIEPYLGYVPSGNLTIKNQGGASDTKWDLSGSVLGARLGLALPLIWFAADYSMMNSGKMKLNSQPAGGGAADYDANGTVLAAVAGVKIPFFQAYLGYGFMDDLVAKVSSGDVTYKGSCIKLGAGYTGLPFIAVNVEYAMHTYTKYKTSAGEFDVSSAYDSIKSDTVMLSVSAPFRF